MIRRNAQNCSRLPPATAMTYTAHIRVNARSVFYNALVFTRLWKINNKR